MRELCSCPVDLGVDTLGRGPRAEGCGQQRFRIGIQHLRHRVRHGPSPVPIGVSIVPHGAQATVTKNRIPTGGVTEWEPPFHGRCGPTKTE
ncbi:hypothetical protein MPHO_00550 [Mycolicibacterium phocaicum]|nr:hypothetical protein MPHO_00550 [Mycolicibacterium phocaicum]